LMNLHIDLQGRSEVFLRRNRLSRFLLVLRLGTGGIDRRIKLPGPRTALTAPACA
jgi:hypothetical protein